MFASLIICIAGKLEGRYCSVKFLRPFLQLVYTLFEMFAHHEIHRASIKLLALRCYIKNQDVFHFQGF